MKKFMRIPFVKLHGLGNDFIVTRIGALSAQERKRARSSSRRGRTSSAAFLQHLAIDVCERHTGMGADGFLLVEPPLNHKNGARVRFFNADGGEAEMSGNGIRCVGAFMMESGDYEGPLTIETLAGVRTLEAVKGGDGNWMFRVSMGRPILDPEKVPFLAKRVSGPIVGYPLALKHGQQRVTVTSMGNPHCSVFVKSFDGINWPEIGREIETYALFPNRTNVEFVRVISRHEIEVRYWERGVGITASSGTGSCGATVASILNGYTDRRVRVRTQAGVLQVEWPKDGEVILTGPAQWIAEGVYRYQRRDT